MTPTEHPARVAVVTVTYGERWHLLRQVIEELGASQEEVSHIVVVDNGCAVPIASRTGELGSRLQIINVRLEQNTGSAQGFRVGIEAALARTPAAFVWLLDDDNLPGQGALARLLAAQRALGGASGTAVAALRPNIFESVLAARGLMRIRVPENSFLGFHLRLIPEKLLRRLRARQRCGMQGSYACPLTAVGYAPYGGLLMHRDLVKRIGLPNDQYYLYGDDYEYSSRIAAQGGGLYLCATSEVRDLELSWHRRPGSVHHLFEPAANLARLHYSVRNRAHLEISRFVSSALVWRLNAAVYLTAIAAHSIAVHRRPAATLRRLRLVLAALRDGRAQRLGANPSWSIGPGKNDA